MAWPWIFSSNFDSPTTPYGWDSATNGGAHLKTVPYYDLARVPGLPMPYRGGMCLQCIAADNTTHQLVEGDIDIADGSDAWFRFYLAFGKDFVATADDVFNIFELCQAGGTVEMSFGAAIDAATSTILLGVGDGTATTTYGTNGLTKGEWHCIELHAKCSTADAGYLYVYVDGAATTEVEITGVDHAAAIGSGKLGVKDLLATTTGTMLIDQFVMDNAQIYPCRERFPNTLTLEQSGQVFVGPGTVDSVELVSGAATDNVITLYDTDRGYTNDELGYVYRLSNSVNSETIPSGDLCNRPFTRGCYVSVAGTNPLATICLFQGDGGPRYYSEKGVRYYGQKRRERIGAL